MNLGAGDEDSNHAPDNDMNLFVSEDGYIRLTASVAMSVSLSHICSGLDDDVDHLDQPLVGGVFILKGYTEWASEEPPRLSLGWDWGLIDVQGRLLLQRVGSPRTNMQFIDNSGSDLDQLENDFLIGNLIESILWSPVIQEIVGFQVPSAPLEGHG